MFGKLKEKLKGAIKSITGAAKEESKTQELAEEQQEIVEQDKTTEKLDEEQPEVKELEPVKPKPPTKPKQVTPEVKASKPVIEEKKPEPEATKVKATESEVEKQKPTTEEKKSESIFSRIGKKLTTIQLTEEKFDEIFWELELALLENNVAVSVIEQIKSDLREELTSNRTARGSVEERIINRLKETITEIITVPSFSMLEESNKKKPYIILIVGINGTGKTTTIAKLASYFKSHGKQVILAAGDTYRAAAIQQLQQHADKIGVKVIKQDYGADPAAVAFDAIAHAKAKGADIVMIDTAGRMHSNSNLMDELQKVERVSKPDRTIFIGEATTGNDCIEQAQEFSKKVRLDGIILSKADIDEQGGASISVSYVTNKPILFLGTGQKYEDLKAFIPQEVVSQLF